MQWSPDRNAGFSRADPQRLYLPPIMDPIYGYEAVNVEAQERDASSMLNWTRRMLATRKLSRAFGRGKLTFLRPGNRKVLCYLREHEDDAVLCVANLARSAQPVELDLKKYRGRVPVEMLGKTSFPPVGDLPYLLTLPAHGFYWFRLAKDAPVPDWHKDMLVTEETPLLVLFDGWTSFFRDKVVPWRIGMAESLRQRLETEVLPRFVASQRWYAQKGEAVERAQVTDYAVWDVGGISWLLNLLSVNSSPYFLPLALGWEDDEDHIRALSAALVSRVRQQANVGVMADALADEAFSRHIVKAIGAGKSLPTAQGRFDFKPTGAFARLAGDDVASLTLAALHMQSTNTAVTLGDRLFLKCYRRLRAGANPEVEIGRHLTEVAKFPNCVPLAGTVEYVRGNETSTVALLQSFVPNQGDAWGYTADYLARFLEAPRAEETHGAYVTLMVTLATRTAELHRALALRTGDPAFEPEPMTMDDIESWRRRILAEAEQTFTVLSSHKVSIEKRQVLDYIASRPVPRHPVQKTRHHGDYHLGQVLISNNDFVLIDFEGEPSRPLAEARRKHTALRDVAGMLRSFSYARASAVMRAQAKDEVLATWEAEVRKAFLGAYDAATAGAGLYATFIDARGLLELAEIEKLLYEIRYEAGNRPTWLHIPLQGLAALLGRRGG